MKRCWSSSSCFCIVQHHDFLTSMYGIPRPTCAAEFDDQEIILHVFEVFHHVLEHQSRLTDSTERHEKVLRVC